MSDAKLKVLIAEIMARPEAVEKVRVLLRDYGRTVRKEPGNRAFICHQVEGAPREVCRLRGLRRPGGLRGAFVGTSRTQRGEQKARPASWKAAGRS